jgi:hypothetical protein
MVVGVVMAVRVVMRVRVFVVMAVRVFVRMHRRRRFLE